MSIYVGIGGWVYEPWRQTFYPEGLPQKRELEYAAAHMTAIEINGTYYGSQKPESFRSRLGLRALAADLLSGRSAAKARAGVCRCAYDRHRDQRHLLRLSEAGKFPISAGFTSLGGRPFIRKVCRKSASWSMPLRI